jgi:hypothetical protein
MLIKLHMKLCCLAIFFLFKNFTTLVHPSSYLSPEVTELNRNAKHRKKTIQCFNCYKFTSRTEDSTPIDIQKKKQEDTWIFATNTTEK